MKSQRKSNDPRVESERNRLFSHVYQEPLDCAKQIVEKTKGQVRIAVPLGLGKPVRLINALYQLARDDQSIQLDIYTALTLARPKTKNELQKRLIKGLGDRLFGTYPTIDYYQDLIGRRLPPNVQIHEFYFSPGSMLGNPYAQQHYTCTNYSEVAESMRDKNINVIGQLVAGSSDHEQSYSLSCNTDITLDLLRPEVLPDQPLWVGEISDQLPYMHGDAEIPASKFDFMVANSSYELFQLPHMAVSDEEFLIGLYASVLVPDGGTLQLGIGALGDAIAYALILRHKHPEVYHSVLESFDIKERYKELIYQLGGTEPFKKGLYACTEMLSDAMGELIKHGIISREVKDGSRSVTTHAAFFLGTDRLYRKLIDDPVFNQNIAMKSVRFTNRLPNEKARQDRQGARFFNTAMEVSLLGGVTSDTLRNGKVVGGVGGQFDFAVMARQFSGRSVVMLRSTRQSKGKTVSTIGWEGGHETIPRHLRDIVMTEYGIADVKGRSDQEVAERLLGVCDERFIPSIMLRGMKLKKIQPIAFQSQRHHLQNDETLLHSRLETFKASGYFPPFPFGTGLNDDETEILLALRNLQDMQKAEWTRRLKFLLSLLRPLSPAVKQHRGLVALGLSQATSWRERIWKRSVQTSLQRLKPYS